MRLKSNKCVLNASQRFYDRPSPTFIIPHKMGCIASADEIVHKFLLMVHRDSQLTS